MNVVSRNVFRNNCSFSIIRNIHKKALVNGEWVTAESNETFEVRNPANGEIIGIAPNMGVSDAKKAIEAAYEAFHIWQDTTPKNRSSLLRKWYDLINKNHLNLAELITAESGKPLVEASGEVVYGNSFLEWYAGEARRIRGEIIYSSFPDKKLFVERQPIGVAALITPWNFPLAMITRKAGAALASGCTCVIKPAEDTPLTTLAILSLAEEAGIPKGVLNVVTSDRTNAAAIGKLFCENPQVGVISFTGSTTVGKILYEQCAQRVKRLGLELGGNAPFIVYESANIDNAVRAAIASKFRNCGQACIASNRFLVQQGVYDIFLDRLTEEVKKLKVGPGKESGVNIGPLINKAQIHKVSAMVSEAIQQGAKALTGGQPASNVGELFYEPTVLVDVTDNMRVFSEEVFGPVISVVPFKTEEESIHIANARNVGLAGYFFSENVSQIMRVAKKLEVGMIGVNEGAISCAEAPFGGVKESGLGREGSHHGIEDFTYYKYVCLGNL